MRWTGESRLLIGLLIAFLLLVIGSVASYINTRGNIKSSRSVEQSIQFIERMESLYAVAKQLDTNAREYANDPTVLALAHYRDSQNQVIPRLAGAKDIFQSDKRRIELIERVEAQINKLTRIDAFIIGARQNENDAAVRQALNSNASTDVLKNLRFIIDEIEDAERLLLHDQIDEYQSTTRNAINSYLLLSFLILVFLLLIGGTTYRYILFIRKEMEADKRVLKEIVEHAPIGILTLSSELIVTEVNPAFCYNTGRVAESIVGKLVTMVIPELPKTAFLEAAEKGTAHQIEQLVITLSKEDIDNERYWDVTVWPVREAGAIKGMILLTVDVTEKVNLSNQREVFAQTLTHDLKTPLIAADRILEAILDSRVGTMDPAMQELLDKIRKNNLDILKMVKDVLEVSRYKQNALVLTMEVIDVQPAILEAVSKMSATSEHRKVELQQNIPDNLAHVWADRLAVKHLILNLVENAIKFSLLDGVVKISAENKQSTVAIHVEDSGPGMTEEEQKKLFKSAWQGELGKTAPSGTGLGLYLCQQIVKAHRGEISCKSAVGKGTIFTVELPKAPHLADNSREEENEIKTPEKHGAKKMETEKVRSS